MKMDLSRKMAHSRDSLALLVAMQVGEVAGDQLMLDIVPEPVADAIAGIDTRHCAFLFLAQICAPCAGGIAPAQGLGGGLADLVGAREPGQIARAVGLSTTKKLTPHESHVGKRGPPC